MSDLNGDDAFRMVLDRLIETTNENHVLVEQRTDAQHARDLAKNEAIEANRRATWHEQMKAQYDKDILPKLAALYAAGEDALDRLRDNPQNQDAPLRDRLSLALREARDYCDQIPF